MENFLQAASLGQVVLLGVAEHQKVGFQCSISMGLCIFISNKVPVLMVLSSCCPLL